MIQPMNKKLFSTAARRIAALLLLLCLSATTTWAIKFVYVTVPVGSPKGGRATMPDTYNYPHRIYVIPQSGFVIESVVCEQKENGVVKFEIEFSQEEFADALNKAYIANREKFSIDGFRKGKAPRKIIESHYGHDIFWDEALNQMTQRMSILLSLAGSLMRSAKSPSTSTQLLTIPCHTNPMPKRVS